MKCVREKKSNRKLTKQMMKYENYYYCKCKANDIMNTNKRCCYYVISLELYKIISFEKIIFEGIMIVI